MEIEVNGRAVGVDNEGFLLDPDEWDMDVAHYIAQQEKLELIDARMEIVQFVRDYYTQNQSVPEARTLLKYLREKHGKETATRKYIYQLFPYGYGQQACKIAGTRKPLKLMLDM